MGKAGVLAPLLKDLLDAALSGELQAHVEEHRPNRRNGSKAKQVKTAHGPVEVQMPARRPPATGTAATGTAASSRS